MKTNCEEKSLWIRLLILIAFVLVTLIAFVLVYLFFYDKFTMKTDDNRIVLQKTLSELSDIVLYDKGDALGDKIKEVSLAQCSSVIPFGRKCSAKLKHSEISEENYIHIYNLKLKYDFLDKKIIYFMDDDKITHIEFALIYKDILKRINELIKKEKEKPGFIELIENYYEKYHIVDINDLKYRLKQKD